MPVKQGRDNDGPYFRWGSEGTKYHYTEGCQSCKNAARRKAERQGRAIKATGGK